MRKFSRISLLTICLLLFTFTFSVLYRPIGERASIRSTLWPNVAAERAKTKESHVVAQQLQYTGVPRGEFEFYAAAQENSQWCWAASIQMVLNYYGVAIDQKQIVSRTYGADPYGRPPNWAGSFNAITANLNNWSIDNSGDPYVVTASVSVGAPTPVYLLSELEKKRPVIIGYASGPATAHAVVITGASYTPSPAGPVIQSLIVRDPWPSQANVLNRGRVEYPGAGLAQYIQAHWYVRVRKVERKSERDDSPTYRVVTEPCNHLTHSLGDVSQCTHAAHPLGDIVPCSHVCFDIYGRPWPCHQGDSAPCSHPMHPRGDIFPCAHRLHPEGHQRRERIY